MEEIQQIKLPLLKSYMKTIHSLGTLGRSYYHKYLVQPLSSWSKFEVDAELVDLKRDIDVFRKLMDYSKLAASYKKAIVRSVASDQFDLSAAGQFCLSFLKDLQESVDLARSQEALQFVNLLRKPFGDFAEYEYRTMNSRLEEELGSSEADAEIVAAYAKIKTEHDKQVAKERALSQKLLAAISTQMQKKSTPELKRELIAYLLRVSTPNAPELHLECEEILEQVEPLHTGFRKEIYDSVAVLIYKEIMKSIKNGDIKKTVLLISKYTVIFRGDPATPHYKEVDAFEKMFFSIMDKKNLWESV